MNAEALGRADFKTNTGRMKYIGDMMVLNFVPVVLGSLLSMAFFGPNPEEKKWWKKRGLSAKALAAMKMYGVGTAAYGMGQFVGLRELQSFGRYGYEGPAGARGVALSGNAIKAVKKLISGDDLTKYEKKQIINFGGIITRTPTLQMLRTWSGIEAIAKGKTKDPRVILKGYNKR
jgi:hypothetical protein